MAGPLSALEGAAAKSLLRLLAEARRAGGGAVAGLRETGALLEPGGLLDTAGVVRALRELTQAGGIVLPPSQRMLLRELEALSAGTTPPAVRFWTGHPTVARLRPEYVAVDGRDLGPVLDEAGATTLLAPQGYAIGDEGRRLYGYFVLDRVAPLRPLLELFGLPPTVSDLQSALEFFSGRFSDETWLAGRLGEIGIVPKGGTLESPLTWEMLQMTRRVHGDAANTLWELGRISNPRSPALREHFDRIDPHRIRRRERYGLGRLREVQRRHPELTDDLLKGLVYPVMTKDRVLVQIIVREAAKGNIKFSIFGDGHNVAGAATALALFHEVQAGAPGDPRVYLAPHYRSGPLCNMWAALRGVRDFLDGVIRQQLSRATDPHSRGRQMVFHMSDPALGILPVQSAVGMQLTKAVGFAQALAMAGRTDAVVFAEIGDATMAESDLHDALTGAAILDLPVIINVVDNQVGISVEPRDGRAIRHLAAFAAAYGAGFFTADGNDFLEVYEKMREAAAWARRHRRPVIFWTQNLSRLNGHSNAADFRFDGRQVDPLGQFGEALQGAGLLTADEVTHKIEPSPPLGGYFDMHRLGSIEQATFERLGATWRMIEQEPAPTLASVFEDIRPPFPTATEASLVGRPTAVPIGAAVRAAIRDTIEDRRREGRPVLVYGQDIAARGGVMQATAGLWERFQREVRDAPINERLILGAGLGFALYPGATAVMEIQFGDYSFNAWDWLIHAGNMLWGTGGRWPANLIVRLPVEPLQGGAVYHSMPLDGFVTPIPGLVIVSPSTSRDAYGLLRTAADYKGPVVVLEPKAIYRQPLGDAFPSEPQREGAEARAFGEHITRRGIPDLPRDFRVPFGRAAVRRAVPPGKGEATIVTWGRATLASLQAAEALAGEGIETEVVDLRTLVPADIETVVGSVGETGRLLVVHEDRVSGGFGTLVAHQVVRRFEADGDWVTSDVLGMDEVPGVPQSVPLEQQLVVSAEKVVTAVRRLMGIGNRY